MKNEPEIAIIGTGAIGSFYGGKLSQTGAHVSVVCRSDYDIIKQKGIQIKSTLGNFHFMPHEVVRALDELPFNPDIIIVTTKVLPEIDTISSIGKKISSETAILLLQNGIGIEEPISNAFPNNELLSGLAFICVSRIEYGKIEHIDYGRLILGKYPEGNSDKVELLKDLFQKSGINCEITDDIISARWKKLLWNVPFNPISVLTGGSDTSEIMSSPAAVELINNIMKEVAFLAKKTGHPLSETAIEHNLRDTAKMIPYKTSMLLDYENKRPMEVDAILGNVLKIAKRMDIKTPYIENIYGLLTVLNEKNLN